VALSRDEIFAANDLKTQAFQVDALGGEVLLRSLSALEIEGVREYAEDPVGMGIRAIIASAVDEDGGQIFSDDDYDKLGAKSAEAITQLFNAISELNGFDVEEAIEDLEETPS